LEELQHRVEQACAGFSSEPAESRFHAHVTLARVRRFQGRVGDGLRDAVSACSDQEFGRWTAGHIELIRSQLTSIGPTYSVVAVGELRIEG
jgi:2'-5' RNA ligase